MCSANRRGADADKLKKIRKYFIFNSWKIFLTAVFSIAAREQNNHAKYPYTQPGHSLNLIVCVVYIISSRYPSHFPQFTIRIITIHNSAKTDGICQKSLVRLHSNCIERLLSRSRQLFQGCNKSRAACSHVYI